MLLGSIDSMWDQDNSKLPVMKTEPSSSELEANQDSALFGVGDQFESSTVKGAARARKRPKASRTPKQKKVPLIVHHSGAANVSSQSLGSQMYGQASLRAVEGPFSGPGYTLTKASHSPLVNSRWNSSGNIGKNIISEIHGRGGSDIDNGSRLATKRRGVPISIPVSDKKAITKNSLQEGDVRTMTVSSQPDATIPIQDLPPAVLRSLHESSWTSLVFESTPKSSTFNMFKSILEDFTNQKWDWWPFSPRFPSLASQRTRISWICCCGRKLWFDATPTQRMAIERLLHGLSANHESTSPCSQLQSNASGQHRQTSGSGTAPGSREGQTGGTTKMEDVSRGISTSASAGNTSDGSSLTPRSSRTPRTSDLGSLTTTDTSIEAAPDALWLLFSVHGARRLLEWDQICNAELLSDHLFIRKLKHRHSEMRGWLRRCFSIWQVRHWNFIRFRRTARPGEIDDRGPGLPRGLDYYFHGKNTATIEDPGISEHEFETMMASCLSACWPSNWLPGYRNVHECYDFPENSTWYVDRLPKRSHSFRPKPGSAPEDEDLWGIRAGYKVSAIHVFAYHFILIIITFIVGGWWYVTHPGDLQGAAVPLSVAGICVSAFWGLFVILGRQK
ncbi:hypothetical protein DPSP01_008838 [Paraphaeosphaeria sporulosa]